jgi:anti-sigma factor RsiW
VSECQYAGRLGAYHDNELSPAAGAEMEDHLAHCPACAAELAGMVELSQAFARLPRPAITAHALQRLHRRVDALPGLAIAHLAEALTAVAASILIACGVWMWASSAPAGGASMPVWEAAAFQKPAETTPTATEDRLTTWMVQDLSREGGHDKK